MAPRTFVAAKRGSCWLILVVYDGSPEPVTDNRQARQRDSNCLMSVVAGHCIGSEGAS